MHRTLACVGILLAGSLVGCSKDKVKEPATSASATQPRGETVVVEVEETQMTPASGTMTPASGATPPPSGFTGFTETEPRDEEALVELEPDPGPVIAEIETAHELTDVACRQQSRCGENATEQCNRVVKEQTSKAVEGCSKGLSRTELYVCLTAINEKACGSSPASIEECKASSLCLR